MRQRTRAGCTLHPLPRLPEFSPRRRAGIFSPRPRRCDPRKLPSFRTWQLTARGPIYSPLPCLRDRDWPLSLRVISKEAQSPVLQNLGKKLQSCRIPVLLSRKCFIWQEASWGWLYHQIPGIISSWPCVILCVRFHVAEGNRGGATVPAAHLVLRELFLVRWERGYF